MTFAKLRTTGVASALALVLAAQPAFAQNSDVQDQPVEETEKPEDEVIPPQPEPADLPAQDSGEEVDATPVADAAKDDGKWDVTAPPGFDIKQIPIRTDEGTWMDVDISPDGRMLAFAMLGDIYTMPVSGGTPVRIAEGLAWEVQPRWSPDGRRIAFTSDRGGGDNIWIMNADGSDKKQLTKESFRLLNQPNWSPDGRFIIAKKHFTTGRSAGTGEVWLYHVSGGGGVALVERPNPQHQKELGEPIYSPDGEAIYYTKNVSSGPIFEYGQDTTQSLFEIERYDIATGETRTAVSGYGGSVRPTPSPDGKLMAFVRRDRDQTKLFVKDLATGREREIYGDLDLDLQGTWAVYGVYPNMDWMPDSSAIVFWAGGKLRRVNADGSGATVIPFRIDDTRGVASAPHLVIEVAPETVTTKMPKGATLSPDGRRVVFESLGKLWVKDTAGGAPKRLTRESDAIEGWPTFSRDGDRMAWVRWTDSGLGEIVVADANGRNPRKVTSVPGHYSSPRFSPDGRTIVFQKGEGGYMVDPEYSEDAGTYMVSTGGGTPDLIARGLSNPQFGADGDRLFSLGFGGGNLQLISTDLNGEAKRVHAQGDLASTFSVSPTGEYVAYVQNYELFVMPLIPGGQAVGVSESGGALPVTKVSSGGADYVGWSADGRTITWSNGPTFHRVGLDQLFADGPGSDTEFTPPTEGVSLAMTVPADKYDGTVALVGGRVLTMAGDSGASAIENGVVLIRGDRIVAVGENGAVAIPRGATTVDVTGKTIIPGLVDAHAHGPQGQNDLIPQQNWAQVQQLALGTTTIHDPSSQASTIFAAAERQQTGSLLGPRIFSTGEVIYGAKAPGFFARIDSYDDALAHVRRIKAQGGISVKNYNQPRREQRQQVVAAARAENMLVVAEGGSLFGMDMNIIADGNSTLEHNVPVGVMYEDVLQFFSQSDTNYTPTLVVTYSGLAGDPYWRQATDVFANPLLVHSPPEWLLAGTARRTKAPEWAFYDDENAREAKKLAERGVEVSIGAHGQQPGIAAHWELWSFVRGGMSPVEALRAGTIVPARSLGMDRDIGSLEAGKLADLIVLDADPSEDIRNSDKIRYVMLGGRMYDARTMNEVKTGDAQRLPYWWED
ncbi:amidohydrolase family protein [Pseudoblastomonas halimionae]|uniref:Amidohydrolase family protein n=1 Tax=Alteriqipengyuania halimionae TaxID=1926630 RepID=A0A6I4U780_9SPHN|nr:amidohydrolase family protein [Alteriqipengyuania halimionae]MXP10312.1 amidohydrolase family protein [Alteriqipengyuania halimionae]